MITKNHWGIFTERKVAKASLFASFAGLVIFAATFIMAPYLALEASAESVSASLRWGTVFLELDTENDVEFNNGVAITPSQASGSNYGTMAVEEKTISVNTSAQNYSVFLSMANDATDSALHRAEMSSLTIDPVDATWDEPGNLTGNTWGYAVPETTSPTSQSTWSGTDPEYPSFSSSYTANTNYLIGSTLEHNKDEYSICTFSSGNMGSGSGSTYTCTMPTGVLGAEYDLWLEVADYNYNYITKSANDKGVVRYAGLSYDDDDDGIADSYILHMQEMTPSICSKLNKWNNETGENARVLHATGSEAGENKTIVNIVDLRIIFR